MLLLFIFLIVGKDLWQLYHVGWVCAHKALFLLLGHCFQLSYTTLTLIKFALEICCFCFLCLAFISQTIPWKFCQNNDDTQIEEYIFSGWFSILGNWDSFLMILGFIFRDFVSSNTCTAWFTIKKTLNWWDLSRKHFEVSFFVCGKNHNRRFFFDKIF